MPKKRTHLLERERVPVNVSDERGVGSGGYASLLGEGKGIGGGRGGRRGLLESILFKGCRFALPSLVPPLSTIPLVVPQPPHSPHPPPTPYSYPPRSSRTQPSPNILTSQSDTMLHSFFCTCLAFCLRLISKPSKSSMRRGREIGNPNSGQTKKRRSMDRKAKASTA